MITMHIATTHAGEARYAQRKKQRREDVDVSTSYTRDMLEDHDSEDDETEHTHTHDIYSTS